MPATSATLEGSVGSGCYEDEAIHLRVRTTYPCNNIQWINAACGMVKYDDQPSIYLENTFGMVSLYILS